MKANKNDLHESGRPLTKEEFINKIKTDDEFANKWGELGPIYGKQWRSWKGSNGMIGEEDEDGIKMINWNKIDQIQNLINDLKTNPDSRRMLVNAWAVHDLPNMTLPPCHYGFQVYTRELSELERLDLFKVDSIDRTESYSKWLDDNGYPTRAISLMFNMRSNDVPLGLPFNLASYGLLLQIIAKEVNMVPDELIASLGDAHIYVNQIDGVKEQLTREPYKLPTLVMVTNPELKFDEYVYDNFKLVNYQSHPTIKMPLSN